MAAEPAQEIDSLASQLAAEMGGEVESEPGPGQADVEAGDLEVAAEAEAPPVSAPATTDELAELRAKVAVLEAQKATPQYDVEARAQLARLEQERATERQQAEQAQRDQRIRTLSALKAQAIADQDSVAAERYRDELDDAKRERDFAVMAAKLQPAAPPPQQPSPSEFQVEVQRWRIENKVWDEGEFNAIAYQDRLLREDKASAGKFKSNQDIWNAARDKVRGVATPAAPRPKPAYAGVEGSGSRAPAAPKAPTRRTGKEAQIVAGLMRHAKGLGLTEKDFE